ncbi:MAG: AAA family ATPase, partial [Candidatus Dadabacteria bacterium]|nr:AAA family ATPase [Candidatus Dadabacteria bacterium]
MNQSDLLRLDRIEVRGLFDMYDHTIDLKLDDRVTLLHGPNGVGKTSVLRMTNAFLTGNLSLFNEVPVDSFGMRFHDGTELELSRNKRSRKRDVTHKLSLKRPRKSFSQPLHINAISAKSIADRFEFLHSYDRTSDTWIDMRDDEILTASEVIARYGSVPLPSHSLEDSWPDWFRQFLDSAKVHLIEAERLMRTVRSGMRRRYFEDVPRSVSSVLECARDFQHRLGIAMADYGRHAQTLDQSFPQRLISATEKLDPEELQRKMTELDNTTKRLTEIGVLDETPAHPSDIDSLGHIDDDTQVRVMTLYVSDTESKLRELEDVARRARLFLENINKKFRHKQVRIDRERGLVAEGESGQDLPLDSLSSGEQHELVLHYNLLFRVRPNTVVLVDEPELSLHVAWQKRFLSDLLGIVELSQFDALIATHSPYIVG